MQFFLPLSELLFFFLGYRLESVPGGLLLLMMMLVVVVVVFPHCNPLGVVFL